MTFNTPCGNPVGGGMWSYSWQSNSNYLLFCRLLQFILITVERKTTLIVMDNKLKKYNREAYKIKQNLLLLQHLKLRLDVLKQSQPESYKQENLKS